MNRQALRRMRRLAGLSQHELARSAGVSPSLIEKIEGGFHENIELRTLRKIASALAPLLGVSVSTVLIELVSESEEAPHA
ncbi:helix-turn-helix domain-containing protein [Thermus brockianus]|uniref:HTH cro/C1-type domain-containing protein n=1 Tax=Thermus brockianus TaxID=56956 RepID=A0ABM7XKX6_THEBO|nr:hypothetical protein TbrSNM41_17150 [Thermus brockianus]